MKFLVNVNSVIVRIHDEIKKNDDGLYQCGNMIFCDELTLKDEEVPDWVNEGDQFIDGAYKRRVRYEKYK